jgi:hypothetical protein
MRAREERALHWPSIVNRLSDQQWVGTGSGSELVPMEERRRVLEHRIELAKDRLVADLGRASTLLRERAAYARSSLRKGVIRAAIIAAGVVWLSLVTTAVRRHRRLHARWK